jgi:hypothetical protein
MRPDRTIGAVTAVVVGIVTALAFAQSFHALRGFAEAQQVVPLGWGWMFAATIDGFVLAALLTSLSLSLQGDRTAAPWAVRVLAVTAAAISLMFNLQHVPAGMARWGAAVPPVAVLAGLEVLLLQVRRAVHRHDSADRLLPVAATVTSRLQAPSHPAAIEQPDGAGLSADHTSGATASTAAAPLAAASGSQAEAAPTLVVGAPEVTGAEAVARRRARQFYDRQTAAGQRVTGAALGRAIGRSERYGRLLLAEFRAGEKGSDRPNGDGEASGNQGDPMTP